IAQSDPETFIVRGKLDHCPEKEVFIYFESAPWMTIVDTIHIEPDGSFSFETTHVTRPQRTSIQRNKVQFNDIFVAPGYELTITADAQDFETLTKTRKFSGRGSEANTYQLMVDSLMKEHGLVNFKYYNADTEDLLAFVDRFQTIREEARKQVFSREVNDDPYFEYFNRAAQMDNTFFRLFFLLDHINSGKIPLEEGPTFLTKHFNQDILDDILDEKWLSSDVYKDFIVLGEYLRFIRALDYQQDSTLKDRKDYTFHLVSSLFPGKLREYAIAHMAKMNFLGSKSIDQLNERREICQPYLDELNDPEIQDYINRRVEKLNAKLGKIQEGGPAPEFVLRDPDGQIHQLSDFHGKIVYIDLWASWCGPCRQETPYLNELIRSYENDERIAFVSIAVRDDYSDWQQALAKDQPLSLQLYDDERFVYSTYTLGAIPQFVLIDRDGNIISINAPRPSRKEELAAALEAALGTQPHSPSADPTSPEISLAAPPSGKIILPDREVITSPPIAENSMAEGTVVIAVCVDQNGDVIVASFTQRGSTTADRKLVDAALKNAKAWKFSKSTVEKQCGTITYNFKIK
ncbi:MAG: redoxin family protein, partial [Lewinella sp.]|nr:redoxin family protein [Lewinella sp.]